MRVPVEQDCRNSDDVDLWGRDRGHFGVSDPYLQSLSRGPILSYRTSSILRISDRYTQNPPPFTLVVYRPRL